MITEVRRLLASTDPERGILLGFETALRDFLNAFGLLAPPYWTYSDIFRLGVRPDMGFGPVLLARLYATYEPVRYGGVRGASGTDFLTTLSQLYEQPALRPDLEHEPGLPLGTRARGIPDRSRTFSVLRPVSARPMGDR